MLRVQEIRPAAVEFLSANRPTHRMNYDRGALQVEGEVIHVIVQGCYNFSRLLRGLTASGNEQLPLLTLSRADKKSEPSPENKKSQIRENAQEKLFPEARNFR